MLDFFLSFGLIYKIQKDLNAFLKGQNIAMDLQIAN